MILNLLRRMLTQSGIVLSIVEMMNQLTNLQRLTKSLSSTRRRSAPRNLSFRPSSPR
jgi:hypothetical protein